MIYDLSDYTQKLKAIKYFNILKDKGVRIELLHKRKKRSLKQNAYLHVLFGLFGIETGYTLHEAKIVIKEVLGFYYFKDGYKIYKHTSLANTAEITNFIDKFREFAVEQGITLPLPNEVNDELLNYIEQNGL